MNIYIAGASSEMNRIAEYMQTLRDLGHIISFDWVDTIRKNGGDANPRNALDMLRKKWAWEDLKGVRDADVVWIVVPIAQSIGCWIELGYAIALRQVDPTFGTKSIVIASGDCKKTIFTALCDLTWEKHTDALAYIARVETKKDFISG